MKSSFSELSYAFTLTENLVNSFGLPLLVAPNFPSTAAEGKKGAGHDLKLSMPGMCLFLQFKLLHCATATHRRGDPLPRRGSITGLHSTSEHHTYQTTLIAHESVGHRLPPKSKKTRPSSHTIDTTPNEKSAKAPFSFTSTDPQDPHSIINRSRKPAWLKGLAVIDMGLYRRYYRHSVNLLLAPKMEKFAGWRFWLAHRQSIDMISRARLVCAASCHLNHPYRRFAP